MADFMHALRPSVGTLFVIASIAVLCLLALSDFKHDEIGSFSEMPAGGERVRVSCAVIDCKETEKGWILTMSDYSGLEARAFLSRESGVQAPEVGAVVDLSGEVSEDRTLIFIDSLRVLAPDRGS